MSDLVNDYFKQFYPKDLPRRGIPPWHYEHWSSLGGMWSYRADDAPRVFPHMVCADGFTMSVQAHNGAYSSPRDDFAEYYSEVEVGFPNRREELLMPYIDGGQDANPVESVYGYVPIDVIAEVIAKHGGLATDTLTLSEAPEMHNGMKP